MFSPPKNVDRLLRKKNGHCAGPTRNSFEVPKKSEGKSCVGAFVKLIYTQGGTFSVGFLVVLVKYSRK